MRRAATPLDAETAAGFVAAFQEFWRAPAAGDLSILTDDVRLVQPLAPIMHGLDEVRGTFARIFASMPDLCGEVDGWSARDDVLFIEFRLRATIGGRPFEWPAVDRFRLNGEGRATERVTWFDSMPLLIAMLTRPRAWPRLLRSGVLRSVLRSFGRTGPRAGDYAGVAARRSGLARRL
jgi:hypothetical protein